MEMIRKSLNQLDNIMKYVKEKEEPLPPKPTIEKPAKQRPTPPHKSAGYSSAATAAIISPPKAKSGSSGGKA